MANADMNINVGTTPDEASARKTGEALGRAAGAAANAAFLSSFNAIFRDIPVSNKRIPGGISMSTSQRAAIDTLMSIAGDSTQSGVNRRAAMKELISATREYARKTPHSIEAQVGAQAAVALGQEAINISARADRAKTNAAFSAAKKADSLQEAYDRQVRLFGATGAELQDALNSGDKANIRLARQRHARNANAILSNRFADIVTPDDMKKARDALLDNTRATRQAAINSMILSGAVSSIGAVVGAVSSILPSMWGQHVTRNTFAAKTAYYDRMKTGGKVGGGIFGSVAGGLVGGLLTAGNPAGVLVGSSVGGSVFGAVGGLFGEKKKTQWEAHQRTIQDMQARIRANNMYRGQYSNSFGAAIQEMGIASASDMENMVGNSQTLAARMMFGQVGENEMLMYSLMPNYFAAAMAGASDAELAAAYAQDLNSLPPMFRLWAGSGVGGGSAGMMAFTQDPFFNKVLQGAGFAHAADSAMIGYSGGWQGASALRGMMNTGYTLSASMKDTAKVKAEAGIFDDSYLRPVFVGDMYNGLVAANSYDLQKAVAAKQKVRHGGGSWNMWKSDFETMFGNTGNMFHEAENLLDSREGWKVNDTLGALNEWLQHESIIIQVNVDGNKQEEIRIRGEQAARAGQMSVYFGG